MTEREQFESRFPAPQGIEWESGKPVLGAIAELSVTEKAKLAVYLARFEGWQAARATPAPIDMILHCPECHVQHIDEPETHEEFHGDGGPVEVATWTNPPHRSHLCHNCGTTWRPADVPTNGVAAIKTKGKNDEVNMYTPQPSALELLELMQEAAPGARCSIVMDQDHKGSGLLLVCDFEAERMRGYRFIPLQLIRQAKGDLFNAEINKLKHYIKEKRGAS